MVDTFLQRPASLQDIDATGELGRRPARPPGYAAESQALVTLARHMADSPHSILQKLADTALELCRADSAGISILETDDSQPIFRWHATAGDYLPHVGATTPRRFSPCGIVIDRDAPQLMIGPVRYYPYLAELSTPISEVLLIPFHRGDTPIGTVWIVARDEARKFDAEDARLMTSLSEFASAAVQALDNLDTIETASRQLADARTRLDAALKAGAIATWTWDIPNDRVVPDANMARLFSIPPALAAGCPVKHLIEAIHPDDRERAMASLKRSLATGEYCESEYRLIQADGTIRWVVARSTPTLFPDGSPESLSGVLVDISDRKQVEQERERLVEQLRDNDARKDEFLAMLAHELRNPLGAISNSVHVLQTARAPEMLDQLGKLMQRQVKHLTRLTDDLLDVARVSQGKIALQEQDVDLADIVHRAAEMARKSIDEKQHRLTVTLPDRPVRFRADPIRTAQMLSNLLTNAAKYSDSCASIDLDAVVEGSEVVFRVRDTGIGISAEMLPKIFGLFTQVDASVDRSQGGLGIGLTLVRSLAELQGGTVAAASEGKGKGSVFTLRLPIGLQHSEPSEPPAEADPAAGSGRVLVVDDNADAAGIIALLLRQAGFETQIALDGPTAIDIARRDRPAVILLDIALPGMNGYDIARTLRNDESFRSVLMISLSGYGDEKTRAQAMAAGFDHHLTKPADLNVLLRIIRQESR